MSGKPPPVKLQPRDFSVLRELLESRVVTLDHISILCFEGKREMAKKRLQRLKTDGLVTERPRKQFEPSVLFLARKAIRLMHKEGHLQPYPRMSLPAMEKRVHVSKLTLQHELSVMDLKVAFAKAISERSNLKLAQFSTWPRLYEFNADVAWEGVATGAGLVRPDGYVRIIEETDGNKYEHAFFVELDRSTMNLLKLASRAVAYLDYYRSGGYAERCGGRREDFKQYPFRVLGIFNTQQRRDNFAQQLLQNNPPIRHQFCLATLADAIKNPLGAIWTRPADYLPTTDEARAMRSTNAINRTYTEVRSTERSSSNNGVELHSLF